MTDLETGEDEACCGICTRGACMARGQRVEADRNAVGRYIAKFATALTAFDRAEPGDLFTYAAPNLGGFCEVGAPARQALANAEGVGENDIIILGSGLDLIKSLPRLCEAGSIVSIENDFPGYSTAARKNGLEHHQIANPIGSSDVDPAAAAEVVSGLDRPLVCLSMPVTNPGQAHVSLDVARAIIEGNDTALVIIDAAYRWDAVVYGAAIEDYCRFALSHPRVLYLNVAAKEMGACSARVSWVIGQSQTLDLIRADLDPYPVGKAPLRYVGELAARPAIVREIHEVQCKAKRIYEEAFARMGMRCVTGAGPWVLLYLGEQAGEMVARLRGDHLVFVQDQEPLIPHLKGWVRVSATVPCQAYMVVAAIKACLDRRATAPS